MAKQTKSVLTKLSEETMQGMKKNMRKGAPRPKKTEDTLDRESVDTAEEMKQFAGNGKPSKLGNSLTIEERPALTVAEAMYLLGWTVVDDGFFTLRDENGAKVLLKNCCKEVKGKMEMNRPFRAGLAKRYQSEHLRHKWALNGQTFIFDKNGVCHNGQHSLVGFVLAEQARVLDKRVHKNDKVGWKDKCKMFWGHGGPITCPCIIVKGIAPEVADTLDLGLKRTVGDVFYRDGYFMEVSLPGKGPSVKPSVGDVAKPGKHGPVGTATPPVSDKTRMTLCNILSNATRLVWLRAGGRNISDAPHFPHSEALDFVIAHPALEDAVLYIWGLEGGTGKGGRKVTRLVGSLGVAAGVYYLMATSGTEPDEYAANGAAALDFGNEAKAKKFWASLVEGTNLKGDDPVYLIREQLPTMPSGSAVERDEKVAMIVKAFARWMDKLPSKLSDVTVKKEMSDTGRMKLIEAPKLGGLDVEEPEKIEEDITRVQDNREGHMAGRMWAEGDSAWVRADDGQHWFGTIDEIITTDDGKEALMTDTDTGKQWQEAIKNLWLKHPEVK